MHRSGSILIDAMWPSRPSLWTCRWLRPWGCCRAPERSCTSWSFCHFVILSFCHFVILSFCHFVILSFCQFVMLVYMSEGSTNNEPDYVLSWRLCYCQAISLPWEKHTSLTRTSSLYQRPPIQNDCKELCEFCLANSNSFEPTLSTEWFKKKFCPSVTFFLPLRRLVNLSFLQFIQSLLLPFLWFPMS